MLSKPAWALGADRIVAIGGAIHNELWMQNKADVVGKPVEVPQLEEATPLGAAMLAGIGVGVYRDEQDAHEKIRKPVRVYQPNPALAARYARWFEVYRQVYPALSHVNWRIFETNMS